MEFSWSEEQRQGHEQARQFAERDLGAPPAANAAGAAWRERWQKCAAFGVQGLNIPEAYGGLGLSTRAAVHVLEGLGRGTSDNGLLMGLGAQAWSVVAPLVHFGTEAQKQLWLPPLAAGAAVGAFALSETESGSDAFRLHTRAQTDRGGYRLQGTKAFVTNAPVADLFLVFAVTNPQAGYFGVSAFLVRREIEGVSVGPPLAKMGLESSPMAEVHLDGAWVPREAVLGAEGGGGAILQHTLEWERGCLLAPALGTMARLLEQTTAHCRARKQFGRPIVEFEAVAALLAEMRLRLEISRLLIYEFAWLKDEDRPAAVEASMTKLYLSESLRRSCELAVHLHGASGYTCDHEYERDWRDAMASSIYSGTTEMQHNLIAESLLRAPHSEPPPPPARPALLGGALEAQASQASQASKEGR